MLGQCQVAVYLLRTYFNRLRRNAMGFLFTNDIFYKPLKRGKIYDARIRVYDLLRSSPSYAVSATGWSTVK